MWQRQNRLRRMKGIWVGFTIAVPAHHARMYYRCYYVIGDREWKGDERGAISSKEESSFHWAQVPTKLRRFGISHAFSWPRLITLPAPRKYSERTKEEGVSKISLSRSQYKSNEGIDHQNPQAWSTFRIFQLALSSLLHPSCLPSPLHQASISFVAFSDPSPCFETAISRSFKPPSSGTCFRVSTRYPGEDESKSSSVKRSRVVGAEGRWKVDLKRSAVSEGRPVSWRERRWGKEIRRVEIHDHVASESGIVVCQQIVFTGYESCGSSSPDDLLPCRGISLTTRCSREPANWEIRPDETSAKDLTASAELPLLRREREVRVSWDEDRRVRMSGRVADAKAVNESSNRRSRQEAMGRGELVGILQSLQDDNRSVSWDLAWQMKSDLQS